MKNKIQEAFENWMEWKLYKILYVGVLVPLLFEEARKWIFRNFFVAIIFVIMAIILLLPLIFKVTNWIETIISEEES